MEQTQKRNTRSTIQRKSNKFKKTRKLKVKGRNLLPGRRFMAAARMIAQYMEVVGSDGAHVGIVERIEGAEEIKLAKDDPDAGGRERYIPMTWLAHAEMKVHLNLPAAEAKARWSTH
jgi:hypothetical protein